MYDVLIEILFLFIVFGVLVWAAPKLGFGEPVRVLLIVALVIFMALVLFRGPLLLAG